MIIFVKFSEIQRTDAKHGVYKYEAMGVTARAEHDDQVDLDVKMWQRLLAKNEDFLEKLSKALKQGKIQKQCYMLRPYLRSQ